MTKIEFKTITKKWLVGKGFHKEKDPIETLYVYSLPNFDVCVYLVKDRFSDTFFIDVGFCLKDDPTGWGHGRSIIPDKNFSHVSTKMKGKIYGYIPEEWEQPDYLQCLEEIHKIYIKPYFDLGIEMLKRLAKKRSYEGSEYIFHRLAIEKIRKM